MQLQGMSDQQFAVVCDAAVGIQYLIIKSGGMATKTAVENVLMARYGLDRSDAHTVTNHVESRRDFSIGRGGVRWQAQRPEPQVDDYSSHLIQVADGYNGDVVILETTRVLEDDGTCVQLPVVGSYQTRWVRKEDLNRGKNV